MKLSKRGDALIKEFEGLRLEAYQDEAGVWTIGWGHTGPDAKPGNKISRDRAEVLFDQDNDAAERVVNALNDQRETPLSQLQFDAAVSFEFNTGALSNRRNGVTRALLACRDDLVDDEMLRWVHITEPGTKKKRVSNGLKRRRLAEAALWVEGSAPVMFESEMELAGVVHATAVPVAPPTPEAQAVASPAVQGSAIATTSAILATATEQIRPLTEFSDTIRVVFVCLALAGVGLAVWGAMRAPRAAAA